VAGTASYRKTRKAESLDSSNDNGRYGIFNDGKVVMKVRIIALLCVCSVLAFAGEPQTYNGVRVLQDADFVLLPDALTVGELIERFGMPSRTEIADVGCYLRYSSTIDYTNASYEKVWASYYLVCSTGEKLTSVISSEGKVVWPKSLREQKISEERTAPAPLAHR
jgi:hypothetical protein